MDAADVIDAVQLKRADFVQSLYQPEGILRSQCVSRIVAATLFLHPGVQQCTNHSMRANNSSSHRSIDRLCLDVTLGDVSLLVRFRC
jgi:hypothetical protein